MPKSQVRELIERKMDQLSKTLTERLDERERDLQVRNWLHSWLLLPDETFKWSTSEIEISKIIRNNSAELQQIFKNS